MTNRQYRRCRVSAQSTWKKSVASIVISGSAGATFAADPAMRQAIIQITAALSRQRGDTTTDAITVGISTSAGVVTSAALIMVAVFSIFTGMGQIG